MDRTGVSLSTSTATSQKPRRSIVAHLRVSLLVAFAIPLGLSCLVLTWQASANAEQAADQRAWGQARIAASLIEPTVLKDANTDLATLLLDLQNRRPTAVKAMRSWSGTVMTCTDAVGVALLGADGGVLGTWPKNIAIDFVIPDFQTEIGREEGAPDQASSHVFPIAPAPPLPAMVTAIAPVERGPQLAPIAYVSLAVVRPNVWGATLANMLLPAGAWLLGAVVGGFVLHRTLAKRVLVPLTAIARQTARAQSPKEIELDKLASAELEIIASKFADLHEDMREAQRQSVVMERRAESNVAEETRRIQALLSKARKEAEHDALTGLTNRRFIEERLEPIFQEQVSHNVNMVIAMFDVDNFKPLNDTEGHAAGDEILRFFGELLRGALRNDDMGVRYGGDEFAAVLMDITDAQAFEVCDRIVKLFNRQVASMNIETKVTLSSGFASQASTGARTSIELLAQADEALYRAKRGGKSQVVGA